MRRIVFSPLQREALLFIVVLGMAAFWRFYQLDYRSFGYDEIEITKAAQVETVPEVVIGARNHMSAPPIDYVLRHFWQDAGGIGESWVRAYGAIWGVVGVLFTYLVGRKVFGAQAALLSGLLLAVSYFHVRYSAEVRFYALLVVGYLAVIYFWLNASTRRTWIAWLGFSFVCVLAFYIHPYTAFAAAFCVLTSFCQWLAGRLRRNVSLSKQAGFPETLGAVAFAAVLYLPWVLWDFIGQEPGWEAPQFQWNFVWDTLTAFAPGGPIGAIVLLAGLGAAAWQNGRERRFETLPLWLTVFVSPMVVYGLDYFGHYPFLDRQLVYLQPALLILSAGGWVGMFRSLVAGLKTVPSERALQLASGLLMLFYILFSYPQLRAEKDPASWQYNNWREVVRVIAQERGPADRILWATHDNITWTVIDWYLHWFQLQEQALALFPWWESKVLTLEDIQQFNQEGDRGACLFGPAFDELFATAGLAEALTGQLVGNVRIYRIENLASWTNTLISSSDGLDIQEHPYNGSVFLSDQYQYELVMEIIPPLPAGAIQVEIDGQEAQLITPSSEIHIQRFLLPEIRTGEQNVQISSPNAFESARIKNAHLLSFRRIGSGRNSYRAETWEMQLSGAAQGITDDQLRTSIWEYITGDAATVPIWVETPGSYQFSVTGNVWGPPPAQVQILVDGTPAATLGFQAGDWQMLSTTIPIEEAGPHTISLVFTNDQSGPDGDRNALIDWVEIQFVSPISFQPDFTRTEERT